MIELGSMDIKDERTIIEARNKVLVAAGDCRFSEVDTIRLAIRTSEYCRAVLKTTSGIILIMGLVQREQNYGLLLSFSGDNVEVAAIMQHYYCRTTTRDRHGLDPAEVFLPIFAPGFEPDDDFIKMLRKKILEQSEASLLADLIKERDQKNEELLRLLDEHKKMAEQKEKLESQLQQSQKMEAIGTLAGGIAHDFNNILSPIIGFTELSIQELHETHPVTHNLKDILQGAKRARDLVNQILTFSRQKEVKPEVLTFQPLIEESLRLLRATIPSSIDIHQDLEQTPICIFGNPTEIQEIIMNLCTNAYHAMKETGGILNVCFKRAESAPEPGRPPGEYCCLSISDTGTGIPADVVDKIFDPYFTTKDQGKGSGLGLSIVHGIVQAYNGYIKIRSNAGSGTVFDVYLPITDRETPKKAVGDKKVLPTGQERILLVDDETAIVKMVTKFLEKFGYEVTGLSSSVEAAQVFVANPSGFDLLITDMTMPEMTGAELAEKVLEIRPDLPIIICSGYSENVNRETIGKLGIKDYLDKPILIDELSVKIRAALDRERR